MAFDKIIPNLYVSDYETLKNMPEEQRSEYFKIATLWPWEIGDPLTTEERYQKYLKTPWREPLSEINIVFSDPEAIDMAYLDIEKLGVVALAINHNIEDGKKVIVFCHKGHERSPMAVIYYLYRYRGLSLHDAEELVRRQHPDTRPVKQWIKKLVESTVA